MTGRVEVKNYRCNWSGPGVDPRRELRRNSLKRRGRVILRNEVQCYSGHQSIAFRGEKSGAMVPSSKLFLVFIVPREDNFVRATGRSGKKKGGDAC